MPISTEEFFVQTIEENKGRVYRICRAYAGEQWEAQDFFQEVVCEIWKSLSSFEGKSEINTWIYRITLNVCYRASQRIGSNKEKMVSLDSINIEPVSVDYDVGLETKYNVLQKCIAGLKDIDRSIILLQLEELSYNAIAEITGLGANNVAVRVKRIKNKLLKCILSKQDRRMGNDVE
jgi:RNA polymerase sigma factor (sigma-70 family)